MKNHYVLQEQTSNCIVIGKGNRKTRRRMPDDKHVAKCIGILSEYIGILSECIGILSECIGILSEYIGILSE